MNSKPYSPFEEFDRRARKKRSQLPAAGPSVSSVTGRRRLRNEIAAAGLDKNLVSRGDADRRSAEARRKTIGEVIPPTRRAQHLRAFAALREIDWMWVFVFVTFVVAAAIFVALCSRFP